MALVSILSGERLVCIDGAGWGVAFICSVCVAISLLMWAILWLQLTSLAILICPGVTSLWRTRMIWSVGGVHWPLV